MNEEPKGRGDAPLLVATAKCYYRYFLSGLGAYWPLLVMLLFPVALISGAVAQFGPRFLFLHDDPVKAVVVGVALAWFWAQIVFVSYKLWLRDEWEAVNESRSPAETTQPESCPDALPNFRRYALVSLSWLGLTIVIGILIALSGPYVVRLLHVVNQGGDTDPADPLDWSRFGVLAGGFVLGVLLLLGFVRAVRWLGRWEWLGKKMTPPNPITRLFAALGDDPWRATIGWVLAASIVVGWCVLGYGGRPSGEDAEQQGAVASRATLFATCLGLALTLAPLVLILLPNSLVGLGWKHFALALATFANAVCLYLAGTYAMSELSCGILAGGTVVLAGLAACLGCLWGVFRDAWAWLLGKFRQRFEQTSPRERQYAGWWLACLALPTVLLLLGSVFSALASPAPLVLAVLAGVVVVYGGLNYLVRRSGAVLFGVAVLLALVSHLQPYKQRFATLADRYEDKPADLAALAEEDHQRQLEFDGAIAAFQAAAEKDKPAAAERLSKLWETLERQNKVRAGRLLFDQREDLREKMDGFPEKVGKLEGGNPTGLVPTGELAVYKASGERPLILVCVSGGGIRSALWTHVVLAELERRFAEALIDFPSHVRLVSGASGGMVGASYYVSTLPHPDLRPRDQAARDRRVEELKAQTKLLRTDFLTPLVRRAVLSDVPGWMSPWPARYDRGKELEDAWVRTLRDCSAQPGKGLTSTFEELSRGEREGWRPSLVFTPMLVEDGRRLAISNLDLRYVVSNDGYLINSQPETAYRNNHSVDALELFRLFPGTNGKMRIATAARMNASFPYFSPAVSLPTVPRRRVVDAGYYDNFGVSVAASWLLSKRTRTWMKEKGYDRVLIVQIRDDLSERERTLRELKNPGSYVMARGLEGATSPPEGLYNGRFASSSFLNDGQLELLERFETMLWERDNPEKGRKPGKGSEPWLDARLLVVNFELGKPASLSWYLTKKEGDDVENGTPVKAQIDATLKWWNQPKGNP